MIRYRRAFIPTVAVEQRPPLKELSRRDSYLLAEISWRAVKSTGELRMMVSKYQVFGALLTYHSEQHELDFDKLFKSSAEDFEHDVLGMWARQRRNSPRAPKEPFTPRCAKGGQQ